MLLSLLGFLALACAYGAHIPGLYGLSAHGELIRINPSNASAFVLSPPSPYDQAQQLSCVDAPRSIFYYIGYDRSTAQPNLVGLSLATGETLSTTPLPTFIERQYEGIGQYVAIEPTSARVFVGGQDASSNHIVALVDPEGGRFEILLNQSSSLRDVFGASSVFIPATNELWYELDLDIMVLNLATKKVDIIPVNETYQILGMNLDYTSGLVYGLAGGPGEGERTVVALDPKDRTIKVVGEVPDYANQAGGITTYNSKLKSIFWLAQKAGAGSASNWYLVQNSVMGGKVITSALACADSSGCPWSLHYAV